VPFVVSHHIKVSTTEKTARVIIADDHDLARAGLREILSAEPSIKIVGEASTGQEALKLCRELRPDVVLMDIRMPEMDGLDATRAIKDAHPKISVLLLTMHADPDYLLKALKAGAAGYVLKEAPQEELISALQRVVSGDTPLDPNLSADLLRQLVEDLQERATVSPKVANRRPTPSLEQLTPREFEIAGYLKLGWTNRQIAEELVVSPGTVKNHVEHIMAKLGVSDRTQAVVRALELGIIELSA
jgi:DNA-binding NarL/FixJ family response regulator